MSISVEQIDRPRWRELTRLFRDHNYRQLWDFGTACAQRIGASSEHVGIMNGPTLLGLADVRIKRIPIFNTGIAYINGGPLVRQGNEGDGERLRGCLSGLREEFVKRRGLLLRIAPPLGPADWNVAQTEAFTAAGFAVSTRVAPYRTLVLDISRPLDEIRKGFDRKWRNHLNRAERNGLTVRRGTDMELVSEFCGLYHEMTERKRFDVDLDAAFYAQVHKSLDNDDRFDVCIAYSEGQAVAGHVTSRVGDTCISLLGASGTAGMQSQASYLIQWYIIQTTKERGCLWYDLGGIDADQNPGVYEFKQGMRGVDRCAPGVFEMSKNVIRCSAARLCELAYHMLHKMHNSRASRNRK